MRVTLYTDARTVGGAEISLGNLLAELPPQLDVSVIGVDERVVEQVASHRHGVYRQVLGPGRTGVGAHLLAFASRRPDILHVNRCVPWACASAIAAGLLLPGLRVVTVDQLPIRTTDARELWRTRALTLRVDVRVAVGEASARRVEDFFALGRRSIVSVPNGVPEHPAGMADDRSGSASVRPRRTPEGRSVDEAFVVGSLGRLDPAKGYDVLLRAVARVDGVGLELVGDGVARADLEALCAQLGICERVAFTGWRRDARLRLSSWDLFVLPSRSEGFPLSIVEAMFARLPVVATTVGSVSEAVEHGETGLLVAPDDPGALAGALRRLRDDPALRLRMGTRGQAVAAREFTAAVMAQRMIAHWEAARGAPRAPRLHPAALP